ncbi:MAG: tryptophan--tRNA ligase [Phycisphaerae bacterium]|nr:tryptophan--tRNA ligase [Phycisphaerae bacterium]NUQ46133.1 tryptophan--tRNA ligase [Phycisphaerae bacterium]
MAEARKRYLSGNQPSGLLHLGNYFGAIREHIALQDEGEGFYFIANYHALTTIRDAEKLRQLTFDAAVTYLACGLDPNKSCLFRQSDVPEVTELTWLLMTVTPMGLLERAVSYKDKISRGLSAEAGLFNYPVLMAADILAYQSDAVPVGEDQVQHVEITRDIAGAFNRAYGEVFKLPVYKLGVAPYVPGTDGGKMSKSYGNAIDIFAEGKALRDIVMGIKTDSTPVEAPKDPAKCNIFALYALMATPAEKQEMEARYRRGGMGYGEAKKALVAKIESYFADARARRAEWASHPDRVEEVFRHGAQRARAEARLTLDAARAACGVA